MPHIKKYVLHVKQCDQRTQISIVCLPTSGICTPRLLTYKLFCEALLDIKPSSTTLNVP